MGRGAAWVQVPCGRVEAATDGNDEADELPSLGEGLSRGVGRLVNQRLSLREAHDPCINRRIDAWELDFFA